MTSWANVLLRWAERAEQDPAFADLVRWAAGPEAPRTASGLCESHKLLLVALLHARTGRPLVWLVEDELAARRVTRALASMMPSERVYNVRRRPLDVIDVNVRDTSVEAGRMAGFAAWLSGAFDIVVMTAATLLERWPSPHALRNKALTLGRGQRHDQAALADALVRLGYERVTRVDTAGTFAVRGDIVDIATVDPVATTPKAWRLTFFDDDIDDVRTLDVDTQRTVDSCGHEPVTIWPTREADVPVSTEARRVLAEAMVQAGDVAAEALLKVSGSPDVAQAWQVRAACDADAVRAGQLPMGVDRWRFLWPDLDASPLDYIAATGSLVIIDELDRASHRLAAARAEWTTHVAALLDQAHVLPRTEEGLMTVSDAMAHLASFDGALAISALPGSGLPGGKTLTFVGTPPERCIGRDDALLNAILEARQNDWLVAFCAGSARRQESLRAWLSERTLQSDAVIVVEGALETGLVWPRAGLVLWGEDDLFGRTRRRVKRASHGLSIDLLSDLTPGDLVVHEEHGIGRFEGLCQVATSDGVRDYVKITYADAELHIATDHLDTIQKYVASGDKAVALSRMGGVEWQRRKERARASIRTLAVDLVALYAKRATLKGHAFAEDGAWQREFEDAFGYEETESQLRAIDEVKRDMESPKVMDRLICGDVGFGKTEIAFRALFKCVMDGKQAALLAPTTVLAEQHRRTLLARLDTLPVNVGTLSRFVTKHEQNVTKRGLADGSIDIVIGTHRLLSSDVRFSDLGLLVIDEEQRFGVDHKETLKAKHPTVDVLSMTATPIPRTLHMALSGIRDVSILEDGPDNRRPIQTYVLPYDEALIVEAIAREVGRDGQVFYLFNDTRRIEAKAQALCDAVPGARIAIAHGQMAETRLETVVSDFIAGRYDVLCCTTIIESGVDMPNVNTLIVENADRLGLAQLYQLRGRVGRSERQAYAYITYNPDKVMTEVAQKRLTAIRDFTALGSGFKIALKDLEVRGAGAVLGGEQSGHLDAIGYDLYTKWLEQEIGALKGVTVEAPFVSQVELSVDAFLADTYVDDAAARIDLYRKLASVRTEDDRLAVWDELTDRFGDPPLEALNLLDIAYIRGFAERHRFSRVKQDGHDVVLTVDARHPPLEAVSRWSQLTSYRGRIHFNAGRRPHIIIKGVARDAHQTARALASLFLCGDDTHGDKAKAQTRSTSEM